jgi:NADH:ubiquinone oxidoreductase subunit K
MIPVEHVLWLGLLQVCLGLIGLVLRRSAPVAFLSIVLALSGVLLVFSARSPVSGGDSSSTGGVIILVLMVVLVLAGVAVAYAFDRFRRPLNVDEHTRMKD